MADTDTWVVPQRWVKLRGPLNFRDIGGYLTRTGAMVAWGLLFRSDSLDAVDDADHAELAALGLATVIDLRCSEEHGRRIECGRARHDLAVFDISSAEPVFEPGVPLSDLYLHMLRARAGVFRQAIELVASAELPVVFHCAAGKDRTGLLAAALLGTLGVTDDDIARDYALTATVLPNLLERVRPRLAAAGIALPPQAHTADIETMRAVLRRVSREHGSMLGYALDIGVDPSAIDALRDRVLV